MSSNLLALMQDAFGCEFAQRAAGYLGQTPEATHAAVTALLPAVVGSIAHKGATPAAATGLLWLINATPLNTSAPSDLAGLFGGPAAGDLIEAGSASLSPALFGIRAGALAHTLALHSGLRGASAARLIALVTALAVTMLKQLIGDRGLNPSALCALLNDQARHLRGEVDPRVASALGWRTARAEPQKARGLPWAPRLLARISGSR